MIHHYLKKGFSLDLLCNLDEYEKAFYMASLLIEKEEEYEKWQRISALF